MREIDRWSSSADLYRKYAPRISYYTESAKSLVDMATYSDGMLIADIGCGSSGIVLDLIQERQKDVKLFAIDACLQMLKSLQENRNYANETYLCCRAENIHDVIHEIDRVFVNSAIWLFPMIHALKSFSYCLSDRGRLFFNFSEWDFYFDDYSNEVRYFYIENELELRGLRRKKGHGSLIKYRLNDIEEILSVQELEIINTKIFDIEMTIDDWINFYRIPAITKRSFPDIPHAIAFDVIRSAFCKMMNEVRTSSLRVIQMEIQKLQVPRQNLAR